MKYKVEDKFIGSYIRKQRKHWSDGERGEAITGLAGMFPNMPIQAAHDLLNSNGPLNIKNGVLECDESTA